MNPAGYAKYMIALLSAKGSKFWQANWEAHVDLLDPAVEGHLHTTALFDSKSSYSVSSVNERFLEILFAGWMLAFMAGALTIAFPSLTKLGACSASIIQLGLPGSAALFGALRLTIGQKRNLVGERAFKRQ